MEPSAPSEPASSEPAPQTPSPSARPAWRRHAAVAFLVAFGIGGWLLFGPKVPKQVELALELSPTLRSPAVVMSRSEVVQVDVAIVDQRGIRVAVVSLPSPGGLEGPRTVTAVVSLPPGTYDVRAKARSRGGNTIELRGTMTPVDGRAIIDVR
jgi:hypothetical protein